MALNGLYIKGTSKTPDIDFSPGLLKISGRSIPEDTISFYKPVLQWLELYLYKPEKLTKVVFKIEYVNSGSNRFLYSMLNMFNDKYHEGVNIAISWFFESDDDKIKNLGDDLQALVDIPFSMMEY